MVAQPSGKGGLQKQLGHFFIGRVGFGQIFQIIGFDKGVKPFGGDDQGLRNENLDGGKLLVELGILPKQVGEKNQSSSLSAEGPGTDFKKFGVQIKIDRIQIHQHPFESAPALFPDTGVQVLLHFSHVVSEIFGSGRAQMGSKDDFSSCKQPSGKVVTAPMVEKGFFRYFGQGAFQGS